MSLRPSLAVAADHPDVVARIVEAMAREHVASVEYPDPPPKG